MTPEKDVCPSTERQLREQWQRAHEAVHRTDRDQQALARDEIQRQFHLLNELRKDVLTDRATLMQQTVSKELYEREHDRILEELRLLRDYQIRRGGERSGLTLGWQLFAAGVGLLATLALLVNAVRLFQAGL